MDKDLMLQQYLIYLNHIQNGIWTGAWDYNEIEKLREALQYTEDVIKQNYGHFYDKQKEEERRR